MQVKDERERERETTRDSDWWMKAGLLVTAGNL